MADIIKLGAHRKTKKRVEKETKAQNNRVRFGRTKAEKRTADAKILKANKLLDGHKIKK